MTSHHYDAASTSDRRRWHRFDDWPMALKLIAYCAGLAAALAIGLTAMGYVQAAQGLNERAEAALSSDALVVTTAIDDWHAQRISSLQTVARLPSIARLLASEPDPMRAEDEETARESLAALDPPGEDVESVVVADVNGKVVLSNRAEEIGSDIQLDNDVRGALLEGQPTISAVRMSSDGSHPVIFHSAAVVDGSGGVLGVIRSRSSVAAIERVVQSAEDRTGAGAMGTLLDQDGLVLVDSLMPEWLLRPRRPAHSRPGSTPESAPDLGRLSAASHRRGGPGACHRGPPADSVRLADARHALPRAR